MGAYAPAPLATKQFMKTVQETILNPTLKGMRKLGLFIGLFRFLFNQRTPLPLNTKEPLLLGFSTLASW